jgi:hypothetical protein
MSMSDSVEKVRTMVELAKIFNVTQPRISQWKKAGMPVESDGTYSVKKITSWRLSKVSEKVETLLPATIENGDLQTVNEIVSELGRFKILVDDFKENRGDIFCGVAGKLMSITENILGSVTKDDVLAMPLRDKLRLVKDIVSCVTGLYEKERLERNLSNDNVQVIISMIREMKRNEPD